MKKIFRIAFVAAASAMMVSCAGLGNLINSIADGLEAYTKETEEIAEGKYYQIKAATVTYKNGVEFSFDNYGKDCAMLEDGGLMIIKDGVTYVCNMEEKVYYKYSDEVNSAMAFIFFEETFRASSILGKLYVNFKESTRTVAGKTCAEFSFEEDGSKSVIAGWKRIILYMESDGEVSLEASSIKESATIAIPSGFKEVDPSQYE